jgi:hypothetical protein
MADNSDLLGTPACTSAVCKHGRSSLEILFDICSLSCAYLRRCLTQLHQISQAVPSISVLYAAYCICTITHKHCVELAFSAVAL